MVICFGKLQKKFNLKNNDTMQLLTGNFNYCYSDNIPDILQNGLNNKFNSNLYQQASKEQIKWYKKQLLNN